MTLIIIALTALLITYIFFQEIPIDWHGNVHPDIAFDAECVELGVIPDNLAWLISRDYVEREDWHMASRLEPTFVSETHDPKWALVVTLTTPKEKQELCVIYNLDGTLYEY